MDVLKIIFLIASFIVAFFIGSHIYKKYGALLFIWKKYVIPISLLVEPYIYIYRFETTTKPIRKRYRMRIIIAFLICFLLYPQIIGVGFTLGYFLQNLLWRISTKFSKDTCMAITNVFADYAIPGKEELLARELASFYTRELTGFNF